MYPKQAGRIHDALFLPLHELDVQQCEGRRDENATACARYNWQIQREAVVSENGLGRRIQAAAGAAAPCGRGSARRAGGSAAGGPGLVLVAALLLLSCSGPGAPASGGPSGRQLQPTPKTVVIGVQEEPQMVTGRELAGSGGISGGSNQAGPIFHDGLVARVGVAGHEPRLAAELPSVEQGTWRLNPDGTMEVTWRLRPNILWHDGTPFSSADLLFAFRLRQDFPTRTSGGGRPELMESALAPDPATFVVRWKQLYVGAAETSVLILPRHLLEGLYSPHDPEAFLAGRYFRSDFVGLGPYRLATWEQGSFMEGQAFDAYYLGRPPIDRVIVRFIPDPNTLIASALGGAVDVVLSDGIDVATATEVRPRWEAEGNRVQFFELPGLNQLEIQHRPEFARPPNGFPERLVRQALYHAMDRVGLNEVMSGGVAPIADSWYSPGHPLRKALEPEIPQFPHDLARAQALLAQAGWQRGPDGVLAHPQTGRFETGVMGERGSGSERALSIIAENWRQLGVRAEIEILTAANQRDREHQSKRPGVYLTSPSGINFYDNRLHSNAITRPENRWSGTNRGGYHNPRVDALLDRLQATIDERERLPLHRQLLQEQMGDVALMPLSWEVFPAIIRGGIAGVTLDGNDATGHIHLWKRE